MRIPHARFCRQATHTPRGTTSRAASSLHRRSPTIDRPSNHPLVSRAAKRATDRSRTVKHSTWNCSRFPFWRAGLSRKLAARRVARTVLPRRWRA